MNQVMNREAGQGAHPAVPLQAVISVHGPRQLLRAFRKRLIEACAEDAPEATLTERTAQRQNKRGGARAALALAAAAPDDARSSDVCLVFDFSSVAGVPFPVLVAVSTQYPECVTVIGWHKGSASGETTIQNGQVKEASREAALAGQTPQLVELRADGVLQLALALDLGRDGILGYCATAGAETWFKLAGTEAAAQSSTQTTAPATAQSTTQASAELLTIGGDGSAWDECWHDRQCAPLTPPLPLTPAERRTLEALSAAFRAEWLWYAHAPEEEIIVERQRYQEAGRPVHAVNLKSIKLAGHGAGVQSSLAPAQTWIAALLRTTWGHTAS